MEDDDSLSPQHGSAHNVTLQSARRPDDYVLMTRRHTWALPEGRTRLRGHATAAQTGGNVLRRSQSVKGPWPRPQLASVDAILR